MYLGGTFAVKIVIPTLQLTLLIRFNFPGLFLRFIFFSGHQIFMVLAKIDFVYGKFCTQSNS